MRGALRAALLSASALALLATSAARAPQCPEGALVPGPARLEVDTTCGPPGVVTITVDPATCALTLDGAAAAGLPGGGTVDVGGFTLREGADWWCECTERERGVFETKCYEAHAPTVLGCGGSTLPMCDGTIRRQAEPAPAAP